MVRNNYFIINKKARIFSDIKFAGDNIVFVDEAGKVLDFGVLPLAGSVYAIMSCDAVRLLMLITDRQDMHNVIGIFWKDEGEYETRSREIGDRAGMKIYRQDLRISSYAWSVAEKLDSGVRLRVTDAVDKSDMITCPECGMLNPKGTPYCLECGEDLS
ncbi:MAG: hypothetical protein E7219_03740 [Clostridiales bacterium]|nr:hypothetical protein [Clostridiales bacterium]